MHNDKTTLRDLSIFSAAGEDVSALIDKTATAAGREALRAYIRNPPDTYERLIAMQDVVRWWSANSAKWTTAISNGTVVLLEKFFDAADAIAAPPTGISLVLGAFIQKLLNRNQYTFIQFSLTHLTDFLRGCTELVALLKDEGLPQVLKTELELMRRELEHPLVPLLVNVDKRTPFNTLSRLSFRARREMKTISFRLIGQYARLDAWQSMGAATKALGWNFPILRPDLPVQLKATGLYHPLLATPVPYSISFDREQYFLFLTGANMSGKTTFMRALGVGALLAHLGMGVPAAGMELSFLHGIITNMHVEDNILKGESYFFAEVQRMKSTAQKLTGDKPHLVLMDELFKGTNVHDAYECTRAVVEGLLQHPRHLMILSTHIHEAAHHFEGHAGILFSYFATTMGNDGSFRFTYELKGGISNDRIGYRILLQEGVINLLKGG